MAGHRLSARSTRLAGQVSGVWGVQVLGMLLQLGYTALTARTFPAQDFGYYGIALAISAPVAILAGLGLANATARRHADDERGDRALAGVALVSGAAAALVLVLAAVPLAALWGSPDSVPFLRLVAVMVLVGPYAGALSGILRRQERFRAFSLISLLSSVTGLVVGGALVLMTRQPFALVAMPVITQVVSALATAALVGRRAIPTRPDRTSLPDLLFGCRSMAISLLASTSYAVPQWSISRALGPTVFGFWNRAIVVGIIPFESVGRAFTTVVYPHFRRHDPQGSPLLWSDVLLTLVALLVVPGSMMVPLMPAAVSVLLGPGWEVTASMAQWLWVYAALSIPVSVLAAALESSNNFSALWTGQIALAVAFVVSGLLVVVTGQWVVVGVGFILGTLLAHAFQIRAGGRQRLLESAYLLRGYAVAALAAAALAGLGVAIALIGAPPIVQLLLGAACVVAYGWLLWRLRHRIPALARVALDPA